MSDKIEKEREVARAKAIDSLARYKFQMFGYWAAIWVHLNRLCDKPEPSPFREIVRAARIENTSAARGAAQ